MESHPEENNEKEDTQIERNDSKKKSTRKRWTTEEDEALRSALKKNMEGGWATIAKEVPGRTNVQCYQRWNKSLKFSEGELEDQSTWSTEEDSMIIKLQIEKGNKWTKIAKKMPGRTAAEVKNHFNRNLQGAIRTNELEQLQPQEQSQPKGFTSKMKLPLGLRKSLSLDYIKTWAGYYNGGQESPSTRDKIWKFMFSKLKPFIYPKAPTELRTEKIWRSRAIRYLNYFSTLILLMRYQDHDKLPEELKCDSIPPWWYVVRFFNYFKLPHEPIDLGDMYGGSLGGRIRIEFWELHDFFMNWFTFYVNDTSHSYNVPYYNISIFFEEDGYLDCSFPLERNSRELFADLQEFIDNYNKQ